VITELRLDSRKKHTRKNSVIPWWSDVPKLKNRVSIKFKPGLNILWGPNGTGKTTVIEALSRTLCCSQGGRQLLSVNALSDQFSLGAQRKFERTLPEGLTYQEKWERWKEVPEIERQLMVFKNRFSVTYDGQVVAYSGRAVGLVGGSFDDDFFQEGIRNVMFRGSAGQTTMMRLGATLKAMIEGEIPPLQDKVTGQANSLWGARAAILKEKLAPSLEKGQPTILMDEPDRSLDIPTQRAFWGLMARAAKSEKVQIIVATHSIFALRMAPEGSNWIEFQDGYLEACRVALAE